MSERFFLKNMTYMHLKISTSIADGNEISTFNLVQLVAPWFACCYVSYLWCFCSTYGKTVPNHSPQDMDPKKCHGLSSIHICFLSYIFKHCWCPIEIHCRPGNSLPVLAEWLRSSQILKPKWCWAATKGWTFPVAWQQAMLGAEALR